MGGPGVPGWQVAEYLAVGNSTGRLAVAPGGRRSALASPTPGNKANEPQRGEDQARGLGDCRQSESDTTFGARFNEVPVRGRQDIVEVGRTTAPHATNRRDPVILRQ